jgi:hypothetical protein
MAGRKIQSAWRYFFAFVIGTGLFLLGFLIVNGISYLEYQRVGQLQDVIAYEIFSDKLSFTLFGSEICSEESYREISQDLSFQGRIIDDLEKKFGKGDSRVVEQKKFYSLILLEHFEFVKLRNANCLEQVHTILFFYSNSQSDLESSEELGRLLGSVHGRNEDVVIYSFDVNLDSELISGLKGRYFVQGPLEILIDEKVKVYHPRDVGEIEVYF